jgi:hypothetical protein
MTSVQSRVNRPSVIRSVSLEESQYQTWSYLVEIARVTQWLPVLKVQLTSPYLYSISLPWQNIEQLLVIECWFGDYFSSIFIVWILKTLLAQSFILLLLLPLFFGITSVADVVVKLVLRSEPLYVLTVHDKVL